MKMDIGEVFCELLSGLAIMSLVLPLLDILGKSSLSQSTEFVGRHTNVAALGGALVLAYSLGLIMDAFGLAIGERWLYEFLEKKWASPEEYDTLPEERQIFYARVLPHVLEHREYEFAYLLAYTNLAIIALPSVVVWGWCVWTKFVWSFALLISVIFFIFFICLEWALLESITFYLNQDAEITRAYTSADREEHPGH